MIRQIWKDILKKYPRPLFLRKTIHKMWLDIEQTIWRRDDDQVVSAKMILEEGRAGKLGHYRVEPITVKYSRGQANSTNLVNGGETSDKWRKR